MTFSLVSGEDVALTPYSDANTLISTFNTQIKAILNDKFIGMYLYGSLAVGDFDPNSSDIDFLVVTTEEVRGDLLAQLQAMHHEIYNSSMSNLVTEIEASYIPKDAIWTYDINNRHHAHIDRGYDQLQVWQHDMDWIIQRYSLRGYGIVLEGPPIQELIAPISRAELLQALWDLMEYWWIPMCDIPTSLEDEAYRTYAIFTMCRILYTIEHGQIVSKVKAGQWALKTLDTQWQPLIQRALDHRSGTHLIPIQDVQDHIKFTAEILKK
jgi:predicted nucleotidyltransferase